MPANRYGRLSSGGQRRRRRAPGGSRVLAVLALLVLAGGIIFGIYKGVGWVRAWVRDVMDDPVPTGQAGPTGEDVPETTEDIADYSALIRAADEKAVQYDYDGAIALLQQVDGYEKNEQMTAAISRPGTGPVLR